MDLQRIIPFLAMPILLIAVEIGALALSLPVQVAGISAFEDPSSWMNPLIFFGILLAFTAFLLLLIRYGQKTIISLVILFSIFLTFGYIFSAVIFTAFGTTQAATALMVILSVAATAVLYKFPEWYVIDSLGVLIAAGVASIFGVSLEILPVLLLLVILAVYDAISVYKTKHMITLAEGVVGLKTPVMFVIPKKRDYSFLRDGIGKLSEGGERTAFIMGMGDLIMPSILIVSANVSKYFVGGTMLFGFINLPALGAMIGSLAGLLMLLFLVRSGKPQAGLPPLNGGAIIGFAAGWAIASLL